MKFWKYHVLGNDFILFEDFHKKIPKTVDWIMKICDRHAGVGGDGVIYLQESLVSDLRMRIFNSNGSEAEISGNGLLCSARYALDYDLIDSTFFRIETLAGDINIKVLDEKLEIKMPQPKLNKPDIPMIGKGTCINESVRIGGRDMYITALSIGNPHVVTFEEISVNDFRKIGKAVESCELFPNKINVNLVKTLSRDTIRVYTYERGVGITEACSSGACASCVAGVLNNYIDVEVPIKVHLLGGKLEIEIKNRLQDVYLRHDATEVFWGITRSI